MPASKRSSKKDEPCKDRCSAKPSLDGSRSSKKRGADPRLCLRTQEGEPRAQRTPTDERRRRRRLHAPLLEVYLRHGRVLCGRRVGGRGRPALHQDGAEALLSLGGGDLVRIDQQ